MNQLSDFSPMPIKGPYEGVAMANVPADYLLNLRYSGRVTRPHRTNTEAQVADYIAENLQVLLKEVEESVSQITKDTDDDFVY
jgi:hypothetical protein